jgi:hypothetical protein
VFLFDWIDLDSAVMRRRVYRVNDPLGDEAWVREDYAYDVAVEIEPPGGWAKAFLPFAASSP